MDLTKTTRNQNTESYFYYVPVWSPDSKYIAFIDHLQQMWYTDITTGKTTLVDKEPYLHPSAPSIRSGRRIVNT